MIRNIRGSVKAHDLEQPATSAGSLIDVSHAKKFRTLTRAVRPKT